jgi:hypothetical protein
VEEKVVQAEVIDTPAQMSGAQAWLSDKAGRVTELAETYTPFDIKSEREYQDAKRQRAGLRSEISSIDAERKDMTRSIEKAVKDFKAGAKDLLAPLTDADEGYKARMAEWDELRVSQRREHLEQSYLEFAPQLAPLVPFDRLCERFAAEGKWFTRSKSEAEDERSMRHAVSAIADDEKQIDMWQLDAGDKEAMKAEYFNTLDLHAAAVKAQALREQRANVRALEEQRAAEAAEAARVAEQEPASDVMTPIMRKGVETMNRVMAANAEREGREAAAPEKYEYLIKVRLDAVEYATLIGFLKQQGIRGTISKRKAQENGTD